MDRLKHINWSELLRKYVETVLVEEEKKLRVSRDLSTVKRGVEEMDRLSKICGDSNWLAEEEVVRWRRRRYSYSMQP